MAMGTVVVGVVSAQFLPASPGRQNLLLQNLSANDVYLNFGAPAVVGSGLRLVPNQSQPIVLNGLALGDDIRGTVNAIASAAASHVFGIDNSSA